MIRHLVKAAFLPPGCFVGLGVLGLVVTRWRPRIGKVVVGASLFLLYASSTTIVSGLLLRTVQTEHAWSREAGTQGAGAIVVLGGDLRIRADEYGGPTVGALTLERVRYAAFVHRATDLPILTSGGTLGLVRRPLALLMKDVLERELGTPVRWTETESGDTLGNALRTGEILSKEGIGKVLLVTHAWHMPRAREAFEASGLAVVPAPTAFDLGPRWQPNEFLPSARAARDSAWVVHEWLGRVWYRMRYP